MQISNKNLISVFLPLMVLVIMLFPMSGHAFTANASFVGNTLKWKNATDAPIGSGSLVLTDWTPVSGMPPTTTWIPGNFASQPATSMTLSGPGGTAILPIVVNGIEYNWSSSAPVAGIGISTGVPICDFDSLGANSGYEANDNGTPCVSKYQIQNGNAVTPFYFIRPIFDIDAGDLSQALEGKASGTYSGTIPLSVRYYYVTSGGALSYFILSQSLTFVIDFQPAILTDVQITGNSVLAPVYNTSNSTVSGSTRFNITATGIFPNGITLTFENRTYEMSDAVSGSKIPYSIMCSSCSDNQIVLDGVYQLPSVETSVPIAGNAQLINFNLDVSYNNVDGKQLSSGTYSDTFTIIFKEKL